MAAGYIPLLGTMIDVVFKANLANLAILESHLRRTPKYIWPSMQYVLAQLTNLSLKSLGMLISAYLHRKLGGKPGSVEDLEIGDRRVPFQPQADCRAPRMLN
jgi:hypothetical protein